jgi:hypothetical protein
MKIPENKESPSLKYNQELSKSMDYFFLRKEGIRYVQELSGKIWTDFNEHDPGVTILEQCCFALTDVAYRTNIDIEKLLFSGKERKEIAASNSLYAPEEILLSALVTLQDRKMFFLDGLKNVANIWFKKTIDQDINGLYNVYVQPVSDQKVDTNLERDVLNLFAKNRSLCEDIDKVIVLQPEDLVITVTIDLYEEYGAEEVLAEMYFQLDSYFNQKIHYDSLETLVRHGLRYDEIFDRPSFDKTKGFVNTRHMEDYQTTFSFSKIQTKILAIKGVRYAQDLVVKKNGIKIGGEQITIGEGNFASLTAILDKSAIVVKKNNVRIDYNTQKVKSMYQQKVAEATKEYFFNSVTDSGSKNIHAEDISFYTSIQNTFPVTYGIGNYGLSGNESNDRKQYAKQLQSYLLFFDQLLLNHLAQLKNIPSLFSIEDVQLNKTYFEQFPDHVPNVDELIKPELRLENTLYNLLNDKFNERKNRLLDHLLARFGERFVDESHHNLPSIYGVANREEIEATLVRLKSSFLRHYNRLNQSKNKAYNFNLASWQGKSLYNAQKTTTEVDLSNGYPFKEKLFLYLNLPLENLEMGTLVSDYSELKLTNIGERARKDMLVDKADKKAKSTSYYKTYYQGKPINKISFVLPHSKKAIDDLVYYGGKRNSYSITQNEQEHLTFLLYFKAINNNFPMLLGGYNTLLEAERVIDKLVKKFTGLNRKSEGFHVVEHILLRPMLEEQYEIEIVVDEKQGIVLTAVFSDSYQECKSLLTEIIINGSRIKYYSIGERIQEGSEKHFVFLLDQNKNTILKLNTVYTSNAAAQTYIEEKLIPLFKQISQDKSVIPPSIRIKSLKNKTTNKGSDFIHDVRFNRFYNSQISLVLPDWLPRFNDPDFRTLLRHSLVKCLPAHILVNQVWLKKDDMREFEKLYSQWMELRCQHFDKEFSATTQPEASGEEYMSLRKKDRRRKRQLHEEKSNIDALSMALIRKLKSVT